MMDAFRTEALQVLVVDDSSFDRKLLCKKLRDWHYAVREARDGAEAEAILQSYVPRIVITDLSMPKVCGRELIKSIRSGRLQYAYIIVLSGFADKKSIAEALRLGADDYLVKPFHPEELRTRMLAGARLLRMQSQDLLVLAMAKLTEYRSRETGFHLERVQHNTQALAEEYARGRPGSLSLDWIERIASLSVLHDIGKVAIPDSVLGKPGKLTESEFEAMKNHTSIGGRILEEIYERTGSRELGIARDIVTHHHERYDGRGYPDGLAGEEIPLAARIVSLADVYDALRSCRVYKPSFSHDEACRIITEERGRQFDPLLVDAFLNIRDVFDHIHTEYADHQEESPGG
ncbi:MAG: response regulator [Synergistales bacterium]|nr:response regulator [Synergistales bacterium]